MIEKQEKACWICGICGNKTTSIPYFVCGNGDFDIGLSNIDQSNPVCPICFSNKIYCKANTFCSNPDCLSWKIESFLVKLDKLCEHELKVKSFYVPTKVYNLTSSISPMFKDTIWEYTTISGKTKTVEYEYNSEFREAIVFDVLHEVWRRKTGIVITTYINPFMA